MLGRFKHEGANITVTKNGTVVAYMGDDERGDYLYKFVSRDKFRKGKGAGRERNKQPPGARHALRRPPDRRRRRDPEYDGTGRWIPLTSDKTSFVEGMSVADVLIDTRLAADKVAPTRMDRPEDVEPNPVNGKVYAALTNNSLRGTTFPVDEAEPARQLDDQAGVGRTVDVPVGEPERVCPRVHAHRRQPRLRHLLLEPDAGVR